MFTVDWFEQTARRNFEKHLSIFAGKENLKFLEIGCFEGYSTVWMLKNILTSSSSTIDVIDTFRGGIEHQVNKEMLKLDTLKDRFLENISEFKEKVNVHTGFSGEILKKIIGQFDFIYVDGSHQASDVIEDAILSFRLLKKNGIMGFDDYKWDKKGDPLQHPQIALDAFVTLFFDKIKVIEKNYQLFIKKL